MIARLPTETLAGRRILLGISGGIAAYKSAGLVRELRRRGAEVRVVLTRAGAEFITPLTLQALSGNRVHQHLLDAASEAAMGHIELARWAQLILVAPASADFLARLTHGLGDDLLATCCLAAEVPIVVAPAMNRAMWAAPATRANCAVLGQRGVALWGPGEGEQACGEEGVGRMLEPLELARRVEGLFGDGRLAGRRVLITAGPTREDLDPVRYISNRSSGRMGFALAEAAERAGARVCLVSGPVALATPPGVERVDVWSAAEMLDAVMARAGDVDIFIACAAVADYHPVRRAANKLKKTAAELTLTLQRCPDIVATVAGLEDGPFTLGFAAETDQLREHALAKLENKGLDLLAANPVGGSDSGFDSEYNKLTVFWRGGELELGRDTKIKLARALVQIVAERLDAGQPISHSGVIA